MPVRRQIITIDEEKCTGCGECIPNCPEGALQVIDGKARLVSDLFCDGLGACIGHCPEGAIAVEEREAEPYDERKVMANVIEHGTNTINAHLEHLREHGEMGYLNEALAYLKEQGIEIAVGPAPAQKCIGASGCPGGTIRELGDRRAAPAESAPKAVSRLRQWPVQITLVPTQAPFLRDADVLIAADCVPFAYGNFHEDFIKGRACPERSRRVVLVGCPKLDDAEAHRRKLAAMFEQSAIRSVEVVHMEVPCCLGLVRLVKLALADAGKDIPLTIVKISIRGEVLERSETEAATAGD